MATFNLKKGIKGLKKKAKKLPRATVKQLPNAAMIVAGGGVAGAAAKGIAKAGAKRAAVKAGRKVVKVKHFAKGKKRGVIHANRRNAVGRSGTRRRK